MTTFRLPRGWQNHPALTASREPFDRRSALAYLYENANWKAGPCHVPGYDFTVERGQFAASIRFLAGAWNWTVGKVQCFLNRLAADTLIKVGANTGLTVITLCYYDEIQTAKGAADTPPKVVSDTGPIHPQYKAFKSKQNNVDETRGVDERVQGEKAAGGPRSHRPRQGWSPKINHPDQTDLVDLIEERQAAEPVTVAAEPISCAAPVMDQPAASVDVPLQADPISTGPAEPGSPNTCRVVVPHEDVEQKRAARAARGTRWPAGQPVPDEWIGTAYADRKKHGLPEINLDLEAANFTDYWQGKAGAAGLKLDWQATWRKWARSAKGQQGYGQRNQQDNPRNTVAGAERSRQAIANGVMAGLRRRGLAPG